ncbi:protein transporter [Reticulomyxa filosa]|uniref:Protein transporter n=1 Tax=Reticulomyxa filosa TaxID=46433 RepID=X6P314_RETFI|nr:protein transporter [Reticulomyxa filosa]|eukprot:ETO32469.1 protein transporter [Reticulomyxa filosa]
MYTYMCVCVKIEGNQPSNQWKKQSSFEAHNGGVNGVSWCPSSGSAVLGAPSKTNPNVGSVTKKFASCGCDNIIKIWEWNVEHSCWTSTAKLSQHTDWVRDVAWAPIPGAHSHGIVASCSEVCWTIVLFKTYTFFLKKKKKKKYIVIIWKQKGDGWKSSAQIHLSDRVWSVSWSELGNILAVASGENQVQLFKEGIDGKWHDVSKVNSSK